MNKELEKLFNNYWPGFMNYDEILKDTILFHESKEMKPMHLMNALKEAYMLGKSSKKCKEDNNNPYHIDHKRQQKLEL